MVELLKLLPALSVVVMVGRSAARAKPHLIPTGLELIDSFHPSPIVKATSREKWETIPEQWAKVMALIEAPPREPGVTYVPEALDIFGAELPETAQEAGI